MSYSSLQSSSPLTILSYSLRGDIGLIGLAVMVRHLLISAIHHHLNFVKGSKFDPQHER
jgi:hypothetical protein